MSNRSFYAAMLGIMFCSVAFALQPTVRAGSISLNSGVKPATNTVTKTASTSSGGASVSGTVNSTARGSALSKFGTAVVPINKNNTANNEYQQALEDLRTAIADLDNQQADLRQRQLTRNDVTEVIANTDLRGTNSGLNDTLTAMDTANTTLQESVQTIQQQTEQFTDALDETMDAKLRQRDLIDANNNAKVTTNTIRELQDSLAPTALATSIAQSDAAKATLNDAGFAKKTDLNSAIENIAGDLNNFVTNDALNTQLTRENLASKLGDEYVKDTDLTQATLSAKLGNAYLTNDTLTKATITDKLGDEYVKDTDFAGKLASSGVATNESVTELASNVQGLSTNVQTLSGNLDALSGNVGTLSGNVQTLTTKVNGDVNTQGSLLYDIRNNADIRTALKGDQGPAGPAGAAGVQGEKGDKGDAGTSFAFRSAITNNSEREECTAATQGYAYYNSTNGNMYICGCINNTCQYAEAHIRGEDGAAGEPGTRGPAGQDAKTPEQVYCETNFDIVSALYSAVQTTSDCADSSKFSNENYTAILGGATAYCLSILQTSSN
ncbi:MAG: hypothetical protein J5608_03615, partial [Alphaproteobacteria bacterium]|nr:hypothetical protein [Alphaproteobacteria bacterium]